MKPILSLSAFVLSNMSRILHQGVRQKVALLSVLPCQTLIATLCWSSHFLAVSSRSCITATVPSFTNCEAHTTGQARGRVFSLRQAHTPYLSSHAHSKCPPASVPCLCHLFRKLLTAPIIASAPSLTLNSTCTATDSVSFRGVSVSAIGRTFNFIVQ